MTQFETAQEVFAWMEQTCAKTIQPGLERMEWMLERLDHPERRLKFIHIAGTNGKGSTAAMIASVLKEAGFSVGMYVSPYVLSWHERIQFDGQPMDESSFVRWVNELKPLIEKMAEEGPGALSHFEFWTLLSLCYFAKEACPWFVVWETGMGGRFDSTNVVYPLVSVITEIGYDHKKWLGETLEEIATEKAGIIKPGVPVICGSEKEEALSVIKRVAKDKHSRLYMYNEDFSVIAHHQDLDEQRFTFHPFARKDISRFKHFCIRIQTRLLHPKLCTPSIKRVLKLCAADEHTIFLVRAWAAGLVIDNAILMRPNLIDPVDDAAQRNGHAVFKLKAQRVSVHDELLFEKPRSCPTLHFHSKEHFYIPEHRLPLLLKHMRARCRNPLSIRKNGFLRDPKQ